ncbi:polyphenol oxidase family protein, partial [bacterium]|nr:polyphenol oxidase family protein [bacterium]
MHVFRKANVLAIFSDRTSGDLSFFDVSRPSTFENWITLTTKLGLQSYLPFFLSQTHKDCIVDVSPGTAPGNQGSADAITVSEHRFPIGVFSADCLPVLIAGKKVLGAVHASWKNSRLGISGKIVNHLTEKFGESAGDLNIFMGPCIGQCCLELGEEVMHQIITDDQSFSACSSKGKKWHLDLRALNVIQCIQSGASIG